MQITMAATGTRGDVQPIIALGKALKAQGHTVRLIAGSNFTQWIQSHGLEIYPTVDIEKLMQSDIGIQWVESPNQREQLKVLKKITNSLIEETVHDTIEATANAELLIGGFLSQSYLHAISEKHGTPVLTAALQPFRPTSNGAASIMPIRPRGTSVLNQWIGYLGERFTWSIVEQTTNVLRAKLGLSTYSARNYSQSTGTIPALYAFSPQVVPPTTDTNSYTTGYWFLDESFTPPDDLMHFIGGEEAPIYFGFGSMPDSNPAQTLAMITEVLKRVNRRGIVVSGWSAIATQQNNDRVFLLKNAPHAWLFPQMTALVHHGGAGTAAAGLAAGKPALLIPHMGDQAFWARRLHEIGVTPKPLSSHNITADSLTERLESLLHDSTMRSRAADIGRRIQTENGVSNAVNWIQQFIDQRLGLPK